MTAQILTPRTLCWPCLQANRPNAIAKKLIDGDPYCPTCAEAAGKPIVEKPKPVIVREPRTPLPIHPKVACPHGCGERRHPGLCEPGRAALAAGRAAQQRLAQNIMPAVEKSARPLPPPPQSASHLVTSSQLAALTVPRTAASRKERMDRLVAHDEISISEIPANAATPVPQHGRLGELWARLITAAPNMAVPVVNRDRAHATYTNRMMKARAKKEKRTYNSRLVDTTLYCWLGPKA